MSASWAVVLVATTPLQTALIAAVGLGERMTGRKLAGLAFGVSGVALLVGAQSPGAEAPPLWAILAALGAGTMYGIASVATKRHAGDASPIALGAGTQLATALLLAPLALLLPPAVMPGAGAIAAMLALALASTALAFIFYFALIASVGPVKTMTVNFLSPLFGVSAGVAFLGERLGWNLIAGGMLILAGLALVLLEAGARQREGAG
jgi:drug/metabolite transporter (DMT)-like permease